jgi:hypothetical protein
LPDSLKTIHSADKGLYSFLRFFSLLGGVAGGSKFLLEGILYKLAQDTEKIYGSDEIAMTSCSHDLKGMSKKLIGD